jgi:hypothetical protein
MTSCRELGGTSILALLFPESIECFWHLLILNSDAAALVYSVLGIARKPRTQIAY